MAKSRFSLKRKALGQATGGAPPPVFPPTILTASSFSAPENAVCNITLSANQPNVVWSKVGGDDQAQFTLTGNTLTLGAKDFEAPSDTGANNSYVVTVRAQNENGQTDKTITVMVTNAAEGASIEPGSTAFGSWAATVYDTPEGSVGQFGYTRRAIGGWTTPYRDKVTGTYYAGVTAWKAPTVANNILGRKRGIKEVRFSANNGPWLVVTTPSVHPIYGNECYLCPIDSAAFAASGPCELRAIVIPDVGLPFILQGFPSVTDGWSITQQGSTYRVHAYRPDMWSNVLNIDKTGTDLPHLVVYKAPPGSGSDSNTGLSAAQAFATWDKVFDYAEAQLGSNIGGLEVRLTAGLNHTMPGTEDIARTSVFNSIRYTKVFQATSQWVKITRDPTCARSQVKISAKSTYDWRCQKAWLCGVETSVTFPNTTSGNNYNNNYFDHRLEDVLHDGGAGVGANGQPNGPRAIDAGSASACGHFNVINCEVKRVEFSGLFFATLLINTVVDNQSENGDVYDDAKVLVKSEIKNCVDLAGGNHLDALQMRFGRTMHIIEDFKADVGNACQIFFLDSNCELVDFALIRPRLNSGGIVSPCFGINTAPKNFYCLDPRVDGSSQIWSESNWASPAQECRFVMEEGSSAGLLASTSRVGKTVIYPSTTVEP